MERLEVGKSYSGEELEKISMPGARLQMKGGE